MEVESVMLMENIARKGNQLHRVEKADELLETLTIGSLIVSSVTDNHEKRARPLFWRESESVAVDGKVQEVDCLYLHVARMIEEDNSDWYIASGAARNMGRSTHSRTLRFPTKPAKLMLDKVS